ncbi:hypothetical protein MMC29_006275 [Sticta canariensis]|nr:hypothetical protein [Sticta canariensis]
MHYLTVLFATTLFGFSTVSASVLAERAVLNGQCTGKGSAPGVCISTKKCTSKGGTLITNRCPGLPNDIKCCTKPACGNGGNCRWTSQCSGSTVSNQCPGPAGFKCCLPTKGPTGGGPTGGYPTPKFPKVGACKKVSVDGAKKIVAGNKGKVREIFCTRDCKCPGTSDHCCGLATDMMCSSAGGVRTTAGEPIAEWVMNNRAALRLKYVIWGQRIWDVREDKVKPWSQWKRMEDRGSITANHWDHVHVSYLG